MVERQEVEALLALVEAEKGRWSPHVPAPTLAALCRAWLALDGGIVATMSRNDVDALALPDTWSGQRVRIVKEAPWCWHMKNAITQPGISISCRRSASANWRW